MKMQMKPTWIISWYLSQASLKHVALISPLSSIRSMLNNLPSPRWFVHVRILLFDVTRAFMTHLFWYGVKLTMGEVTWLAIVDVLLWAEVLLVEPYPLPFDDDIMPLLLAGLLDETGSTVAAFFGTFESDKCTGSPIFAFTSVPGCKTVRSNITTTFLFGKIEELIDEISAKQSLLLAHSLFLRHHGHDVFLDANDCVVGQFIFIGVAIQLCS